MVDFNYQPPSTGVNRRISEPSTSSEENPSSPKTTLSLQGFGLETFREETPAEGGDEDLQISWERGGKVTPEVLDGEIYRLDGLFNF